MLSQACSRRGFHNVISPNMEGGVQHSPYTLTSFILGYRKRGCIARLRGAVEFIPVSSLSTIGAFELRIVLLQCRRRGTVWVLALFGSAQRLVKGQLPVTVKLCSSDYRQLSCSTLRSLSQAHHSFRHQPAPSATISQESSPAIFLPSSSSSRISTGRLLLI